MSPPSISLFSPGHVPFFYTFFIEKISSFWWVGERDSCLVIWGREEEDIGIYQLPKLFQQKLINNLNFIFTFSDTRCL